MCGIAGLITVMPDEVDPGLISRILHRLEHRGPDDHGVLLFSPKGLWLGREWGERGSPAEVVLLHRRLSILDLTESGWQPMGTADGRYHIIFNGEIYNYLELRRELETLGHLFRSQSDTEVLLAAYVQWGSQVLNRLIGMFAFAILDTRERKLFLARDFFGIKPLYYTRWRNGFAFASEIKALLELSGISHGVNPERLYLYLRHGLTDHGGETLFAGIRQVPPAHYLEVSLDAPWPVEPVGYWKVDMSRRLDLSFAEAAQHLRDLFLESIRIHLRSDVPVGAALSGGIDSSAIVMAMRHLAGRDLDIHAFSYIADDPAISEERWVDLMGEASGAVVHKVWPRADELVADLKDLIFIQDEPFGSTSIYAQHRIFRLARQAGIKVMLDGQGADEMLGGYPVYAAARFASLVRQGRWSEAVRFLRSASRWPGKGGLWLQAGQFLLPTAFQGPLRRLVGQDLAPSWLNAVWFAERGVVPRPLRHPHGDELLRDDLQQTLTETNLPMLLRYEDRNSMAHSIESRVPFLTPALASFILALPEEFIIAPDGTSKAVFRQAMRGVVPDAILDRRDKIGFVTPERHWLTALGSWVDQVLRSETSRQIPAFVPEAMEREWRDVRSGQRPFNFRVWRWVNVIEWARQFGVRFE